LPILKPVGVPHLRGLYIAMPKKITHVEDGRAHIEQAGTSITPQFVTRFCPILNPVRNPFRVPAINGTWLVVLSACETGSGEARAGEGVMGLRRGFIQAGARNLLMTLWPISDKTTVQIMLDFYEAADKTHNAPEALAEVQRAWLVKLRKESDLSEAVGLAGAFIMSSQGKL
jgi:hypothetical protein